MNNYIKIKEERFQKEGCMYYFNAQHIYLNLNNKERCFFDFLCEKMDDTNGVTIDSNLKSSFIEFIEEITSNKKSIGIETVREYAKKLNKLKLILKVANSNFYYVNPKYVFKESIDKRKKLLKKLLFGNTLIEEEKNKLRSNPVV